MINFACRCDAGCRIHSIPHGHAHGSRLHRSCPEDSLRTDPPGSELATSAPSDHRQRRRRPLDRSFRRSLALRIGLTSESPRTSCIGFEPWITPTAVTVYIDFQQQFHARNQSGRSALEVPDFWRRQHWAGFVRPHGPYAICGSVAVDQFVGSGGIFPSPCWS